MAEDDSGHEVTEQATDRAPLGYRVYGAAKTSRFHLVTESSISGPEVPSRRTTAPAHSAPPAHFLSSGVGDPYKPLTRARSLGVVNVARTTSPPQGKRTRADYFPSGNPGAVTFACAGASASANAARDHPCVGQLSAQTRGRCTTPPLSLATRMGSCTIYYYRHELVDP